MNICRGWGKKKCTNKLPFYNYFKPNFRHLHEYLSQNWSSDGHFEVLNGSIYKLVKKLWQKWKTRKNAKITKNSTYENFFLQNRTKMKMEKIAFCVITFDPIKIQTHSAPQNDRLNFSFVNVDGGNLAWNSCKMAICQCTFFLPTLYDTSGSLVFVRFLEEIEDTKRHFEINWPLPSI